MWSPKLSDVLFLHEKLIERTGGAAGVRSFPLIESALGRFNASFGGKEAHSTLEEKAAAVACGLIQNHGFVDGNKRVGVAVLLLILRMNGLPSKYSKAELVRLGLSVAQGEMDVEEVTAWILAEAIQ